ncbi:LD-carboxypeptidase [Gangjinia marincola]|uniref:LD-carboxypeptidase n=1 Tax=Gangjinia marincola TaxID=578463 RepID=A0ABP3XWB0_9FLAO
MKIPAVLKRGDKVAIVATARKISTNELAPAIALLKSWDLVPVLGKSIDAEDHQFAGSGAWRAEDLQHMLDDPSIKAIWCARGGYGTVRMLDKLTLSAFAEKPKWILGYSDVTALHSTLHNLGIASLHGQMCLDVDQKTEACRDSIKNALFGNLNALSVIYPSDELNRKGTATGELIGGNLSVLFSLCGSASAINTSGKILFLEDLDEYLYHIDRMMQNLKRNGMLDNLAGLIIGGMTGMHDNTIAFGKSAEEIILDTVKDFDYPVCVNFPAGHITDNRTLMFGAEASLTVEVNVTTLKYI